jgi:PST family polysaccharide transporter
MVRLLLPGDFGLVALSMAVVSFTWWFVDLSFGTALVRAGELDDADKSTAFWVNCLSGVAVTAVVMLLAPLAAHFLRDDRVVPVLAALSLTIALSAPEGTLAALLQRELDFRAIAVRRVLATLVGGSVGILLAVRGYGVWALVADALLRSLAGTSLLLLAARWRPSLRIDRGALARLWTFSRPIIGGRLLDYLSRNADTLLVGRYIGAAAVGHYSLGYQFVLLPLLYVSRPVQRVLLSALARIAADEDRMRDAWLKGVRATALALLPPMAVLALASHDLVVVLLGERWVPIVPLVPFLCVAGVVQAVQTVNTAAVLARGRSDVTFPLSLLTCLTSCTAFVVGLRWGIVGVAAASAAAAVLAAPAILTIQFTCIGARWGMFLRALRAPLQGTAVAAALWAAGGPLVEALPWADGMTGAGRLFLRLSLAGAGHLVFAWSHSREVQEIVAALRGARS